MARINLVITNQSKPMPDDVASKVEDISWNHHGNGIEVYPKSESFPMPFDSGCYIENGFFIIDGDLGQQGNNRSWAKVGIPLDKVMNYLDLEIYVEDDQNNEGYIEELNDILSEYGWI